MNPAVAAALAKAWEFARNTPWLGWVAAALLVLPLAASQRALNGAREALATCQEAAANAPKATVTEKTAAASSVRVRVVHPAITPPDGVAASSSWPAQAPCPDVVVEASSNGSTEREEKPAPAPVIVAKAGNALVLGGGYEQNGPYLLAQLELGKLETWLTLHPGLRVGAGVGYRWWSW